MSIKNASFHAEIIIALKTASLHSRKDIIQEGEADEDAEALAVRAIAFAAFENQQRVAEHKKDDERTQYAEINRSLAVVNAVVHNNMATKTIPLDVFNDVLQQIIPTNKAPGERLAPDTAASSHISLCKQANKNEARVVLHSDKIPDEEAELLMRR